MVFWSVTTQEYIPSSPVSVGSIRRLLLNRYEYLEMEGERIRPPLCHVIENEPVDVNVQLKSAGLPLAITRSLGGMVNAGLKQAIISL